MRWISARDRFGQEVHLGADAAGQFWIDDLSGAPPKSAGATAAVRPLKHADHVTLTLPDGSVFNSQDLETLRAWFPALAPRRKPMRPGVVLLWLLAGFLLFLYALIKFVIPTLGDWAAGWVPKSFEQSLQGPVAASLSAQGFGPTALADDRQAHYRQLFNGLLTDLPDKANYQLEFKSFSVPNAFAMPGGLVVFTDPMFNLLEDDAEFIAVAAHEIGHVEKRHIVRNLMRASTMTLLFALIAGDVGSAIALADSVPGILLSSAYSRDFEREADSYAFEVLKRHGHSPVELGEFLERLEKQTGGDEMPGVLVYASSHPATQERIAAAKEAAAGN
jgi:Zn-dependent protease with chaperone function